MNIALDKKDDVNGIISIELKKEDYQEKVDKSMKHLRNRANIPGFRRGKVPLGVIKKMYGKSVLVEEINKLVSETLYGYIRENKIQILGEPLPQYSEENKIDFDKEEEFTFKFDVGLSPEFDLPLSENDTLTYYNVSLENKLLKKQMESYQQNYGFYTTVEEAAKETDLLKGLLTELDDTKENKIVVEEAVLMPSYIKDEDEKKKFVGAKKGETIIFNPTKAYDNTEAELASLMHIGKEEVTFHNGNFSFEIKEVTRYKEAELNQELFDKVLGEGVVKTKKAFEEKIKSMLEEQFKPGSDYKFSNDARAMILDKMKTIKFPDEFLKRWLKESSEDKTPEDIEKEYPTIIDDLKFHLAKEKIVNAQEIKVEQEEIQAFAEKVAKSQFAQYGMTNVPVDALQNYVHNMLEKEDTVRGFVSRIIEEKVMKWIKSQIKIDEQTIASENFSKMMKEKENEENEAEAKTGKEKKEVPQKEKKSSSKKNKKDTEAK